MGIFDRIFGTRSNPEPQPNIRFGRYSDSYKEEENYGAWDMALQKFEKEEYLQSYREFFKYLRDEEEDNVKFWEKNDGLEFELYQGSKKITGYANNKKLRAEAKVALSPNPKVGFMRRLIEQNFNLKYSRFALDEQQNLTIVFDTYTLDGSPYKLYYALKELATNADKQDDLLLDEFENLEPVDVSHLNELSPEEKEAKYNFIQKTIKETFEVINSGKLDSVQYPGGIAYLLLNLIYRLDYLTKPEGYMMELLERIHRLYFAQDGKNTVQKNQFLCKELQKLIDRQKEAFFKEMYEVKSTFGITIPVNHDRVVGFIDGEIHNMDWYQENGHDAIALSVPGYIVGFCLFNYAVPKPDKDLFHLYFQIIESEYFNKLGFSFNYYDSEEQKFNKKSIRRAIDAIADKNSVMYPKVYPATGDLKFGSMADFAKSYIMMIRNLDMTKAE